MTKRKSKINSNYPLWVIFHFLHGKSWYISRYSVHIEILIKEIPTLIRPSLTTSSMRGGSVPTQFMFQHLIYVADIRHKDVLM